MQMILLISDWLKRDMIIRDLFLSYSSEQSSCALPLEWNLIHSNGVLIISFSNLWEDAESVNVIALVIDDAPGHSIQYSLESRSSASQAGAGIFGFVISSLTGPCQDVVTLLCKYPDLLLDFT